jgi:hypothetical protein
MAMTPSAAVAVSICSSLNLPASGATLAYWTSVVDAIRTMVTTATVTVSTTVSGAAAGVTSGPASAVVTGTGTGTGTVS